MVQRTLESAPNQTLTVLGKQQAKIAQIMAGWSGDYRVAEGSEQRTGVKGRQTLLRIESERIGSGHGGGVGDGPGGTSIAVYAVRACAEHGETFAGIFGQFQRADKGKLLVAAAGAAGAAQGNRNLAAGDDTQPRVDGPRPGFRASSA